MMDEIKFAAEEAADIDSFEQGALQGIWAFAWMRDGTYYVGTCGTTLKQAKEEVKAACEWARKNRKEEALSSLKRAGLVDKDGKPTPHYGTEHDRELLGWKTVLGTRP